MTYRKNTSKSEDKIKRDPVIIFHRSKQNAEESLANQHAFLEAYKEHLPLAATDYIDYMTGDYPQVLKIRELVHSDPSSEFIVIVNSSLSRGEFDEQFNMYRYFELLKALNRANLYYMDSEGKLFKEIKNIKEVGKL